MRPEPRKKAASSGPGRPSRASMFVALFAGLHALALVGASLMQYLLGPAFQVEIFRNYAEEIFAGNVPYRDFPHEYPPLSLFILLLPRLLSADPALYAALFGAQMLLFSILILFALSRIGAKPVILYGVGLLLFWRLPFIRHDLVPVAAAAAGGVLLLRGRALWAAVLWGAAGALKLYPMVAVPALAFGAGARETAKRWAVAGAVFAAGILWGVLAFGAESFMFFGYHSDRPAMVESIPANVQLLLPGAEVVHSYGSFNVVGPLSDPLVTSFEVLQLLATGLALAAVWWQARRSGALAAAPAAVAVRAAALATFAFAVFGKVLSPHFLLWPLPLLALASGVGQVRFEKVTWVLLFAVIALTTFVNSQYYAISEDLPYFTALLTARNALLPPLFLLLLLPPKKVPAE